MLRLLDNADWGFDSNCFVCEPRNDRGLRVPFFHDTEANRIVARFTLGPEFSGAPNFVHGGISLALLDEAMAWVAIAMAGKFAVTTETTTRFLRPVRVGATYRIEAQITEVTGAELKATARVVDDDDGDRARAESSATFAVLSAATATEAIGQVSEAAKPYLR